MEPEVDVLACLDRPLLARIGRVLSDVPDVVDVSPVAVPAVAQPAISAAIASEVTIRPVDVCIDIVSGCPRARRGCAGCRARGYAVASTMSAIPWPPPMQALPSP